MKTDEHYTTDENYDDIINLLKNDFKIDTENAVRPFWPGADYKTLDYTDKKVIDNPPFSLEKEIVDYYMAHNIPFFLWASGKDISIYVLRYELSVIYYKPNVKYKSGLIVMTKYITNLIVPAGIYVYGHSTLINDREDIKNLDALDLGYLTRRDKNYFIPYEDIAINGNRQNKKTTEIILKKEIKHYERNILQ